MPESSPQQQLRATIDVLLAKAADLLSRADHETTKAQVQFAKRDLDEAGLWLNLKGVDNRPPILRIAEGAIEFAARRLEAVEKALTDYGRNAEFINIG